MLTSSKIKIFLAGQPADCKHQLENLGYPAVFSFASPDACLKRLPLRPDLILLPCPVKSPEGMNMLKKIYAFDRQTMVMYIGDTPVEAAMRRAERKRAYRRMKQAVAGKIKAFMSSLLSVKR